MTCQIVPAALTAEQQGQVCGILSVGCDWQTAADFVGCSLADIRRTIEHDAQFAVAAHRAEAGAELSHMRTVQQAAKEQKNWRASVWWLERHSPERYARRARVVTPRQIKAFVAILADVVRDSVTNADDQQRIIDRLQSLADSIAQMLDDDSMDSCSSAEADTTTETSYAELNDLDHTY